MTVSGDNLPVVPSLGSTDSAELETFLYDFYERRMEENRIAAKGNQQSAMVPPVKSEKDVMIAAPTTGQR